MRGDEEASPRGDGPPDTDAASISSGEESLPWEVELSVCWVSLLDKSYNGEVALLVLFVWPLLLCLSTAQLLAGFLGAFRFLIPAQGDCLCPSRAPWLEPLFTSSLLLFLLSLAAAVSGYEALRGHHVVQRRLRELTLHKTFDTALALHAAAAVASALSGLKLLGGSWFHLSAKEAPKAASSPGRRTRSRSLARDEAFLLSAPHEGKGETWLPAQPLPRAAAHVGPALAAASSPQGEYESPLYQPLLLTCLCLNAPLLFLNGAGFLVLWRVARKVGRLFGVRMPQLPF